MSAPCSNPQDTGVLVLAALEHLADGYTRGMFKGSVWGVTVKRSADATRIWLYAQDLAGTDIVSFNLYRLRSGHAALKPCEMSSDKILSFMLGFVPS